MNNTAVLSYDTAEGLRALAAANLRAAAQATAAAEGADPALVVRLRNAAMQAADAARAAAWAAGLLDGTDPGTGTVTVRLLAGTVSTGFGDKAVITVPGEPEALAWHAGAIAGQAGIPRDQLNGTEVSFVSEDWGDDQVFLHAFQPAGLAGTLASRLAFPGGPVPSRPPGTRLGHHAGQDQGGQPDAPRPSR